MDHSQHEFLIGLEELVEQTALDLDELRRVRSDGRAQRKLIDAIFRRVHTVKGSAASFGLSSVSQVAHEFETLLAAVRDGSIELNTEILALCEAAADALSETLSLAASGVTEEVPRTDLFNQLQAAARDNPRAQPGPSANVESVSPEVWQAMNESEKNRLSTMLEDGIPVFNVTAGFEVGEFDTGFAQLQDRLNAVGEIVSTSPAVDAERPGKIIFRLIYATDRANNLDLIAEGADIQIRPLTTSRSSSAISSTVPVASVSSQSNFVRADLDKLDRLISSIHELFRTTTSTLELAISRDELPASVRQELTTQSEQARRSFLGVEEELINLRMVSLGPTLQRAARAGRAAARIADKKIQFGISGSDLRLDKMLADAIADPLIHLVRNAVDHGIEPAEIRQRSGKNTIGLIRIEAIGEGSQSVVRVTDDGRGIDTELISDAAARLGISKRDCRLDFERSLRLIFRPGFTTSGVASDVSGRGVGLDIVETAVEHVGGQLRVASRAGAGTTFEIRIPVTFGLLPALVVVSGGHRYCIASNEVVEVDNRRVLNFSLRQLLGQPPADGEQALINYSGVTNGDHPGRAQISVDHVEGTQEVLVRNLGRHAGRWTGVVGATELRDGSVALVLDLNRLLSRADGSAHSTKVL